MPDLHHEQKTIRARRIRFPMVESEARKDTVVGSVTGAIPLSSLIYITNDLSFLFRQENRPAWRLACGVQFSGSGIGCASSGAGTGSSFSFRKARYMARAAPAPRSSGGTNMTRFSSRSGFVPKPKLCP